MYRLPQDVVIKTSTELSTPEHATIEDDVLRYSIIDEESEEDKVRDTDEEEHKDAEIEILDCEESISDETEDEIEKFQIASNKLFSATVLDGSTQRYTTENDDSFANCSLDRIDPHSETIPQLIRRYKSINDLSIYKNLKQF